MELAAAPAALVDVTSRAPVVVRLAYAQASNVTGAALPGYDGVCRLRPDAAEAVARAQARLRECAPANWVLVLFDCYRPPEAVAAMVAWSKTSDERTKAAYYPRVPKHALLAQGYISPTSRHSAGATIDVGLGVRGVDGQVALVDMGTPFDMFDPRSATASREVSAAARAHRALLAKVLAPEFRGYAKEWWHFTLRAA